MGRDEERLAELYGREPPKKTNKERMTLKHLIPMAVFMIMWNLLLIYVLIKFFEAASG